MSDRAFFLLRAPGAAEPHAVAAQPRHGAAEVFVPGSGWHPMPSLAPRLHAANRVCADRAQQMISEGVGPRLTPSELSTLRKRR